jgi:hypothetical protein
MPGTEPTFIYGGFLIYMTIVVETVYRTSILVEFGDDLFDVFRTHLGWVLNKKAPLPRQKRGGARYQKAGSLFPLTLWVVPTYSATFASVYEGSDYSPKTCGPFTRSASNFWAVYETLSTLN